MRYVPGLMAKLISPFPTEPGEYHLLMKITMVLLCHVDSVASSTVACKHEELDGLYSNMNKMILEELQSYEKCVL